MTGSSPQAAPPARAPQAFEFDTGRLVALWPQLHAGDAEPLPDDPHALEAWRLCHGGDFDGAARLGQECGGSGEVAAHCARYLQAAYFEGDEKTRLDMLDAVARQAWSLAQRRPERAADWYWHAVALGRYSQGVSVARSLALGLGLKVRESFERAVQLQPRHADALLGLACFHAEVIDKVGPLIGKMTYGVSREASLQMFREAQRLNPDSPLMMLEMGHGLLMLHGDEAREEARQLYEQAARCEPRDAIEQLVVRRARSGMQD